MSRSGPALAWLGVATILLIDVSGLLRAETARVWLFLQPVTRLSLDAVTGGYDRPVGSGPNDDEENA